MTGDEYKVLATRTINQRVSIEDNIINAALGICGEAGEVADIIKKHMYQGHSTLDTAHVTKELGDIMWYIALMCTMLGVSLDDVMQQNIDKLNKRYPEGFNAEQSMHRKEGDI